jgi:hypothetical protein
MVDPLEAARKKAAANLSYIDNIYKLKRENLRNRKERCGREVWRLPAAV